MPRPRKAGAVALQSHQPMPSETNNAPVPATTPSIQATKTCQRASRDVSHETVRYRDETETLWFDRSARDKSTDATAGVQTPIDIR